MMAYRPATESGMPPYLIPHAIACQIHKQGEYVYHTSEKMVHLHHYNITVRTKSLRRELRPGHARVPSSRHEPADHSDGVRSDHDSGDAP